MPIDYNEYHKNWKKISQDIRINRAKNKCEKCEAENKKPHPVTGSIVILTVAHLDHDINNNDYKNLKAFCQKCHLNYDLNHHIHNRKYGKDTIKLNYDLFENTELAFDPAKRIKKL